MLKPRATSRDGTCGPVSSGDVTRSHYSWPGGSVGVLSVTLSTPLSPFPALMPRLGDRGVSVDELWRVLYSGYDSFRSRLVFSVVEDIETVAATPDLKMHEDGPDGEVQNVMSHHIGTNSVVLRHHSTLRFSIPAALLSVFTIPTAHRNRQVDALSTASRGQDDALGQRGTRHRNPGADGTGSGTEAWVTDGGIMEVDSSGPNLGGGSALRSASGPPVGVSLCSALRGVTDLDLTLNSNLKSSQRSGGSGHGRRGHGGGHLGSEFGAGLGVGFGSGVALGVELPLGSLGGFGLGFGSELQPEVGSEVRWDGSESGGRARRRYRSARQRLGRRLVGL